MRLAPTPAERLNTASGRAYFLWDTDVSWQDYVQLVASEDRDLADYWLARGLRDAKPDDMLGIVSLEDIAEAWDRIAFRLGRQRAFWRWLLQRRGLHVSA